MIWNIRNRSFYIPDDLFNLYTRDIKTCNLPIGGNLNSKICEIIERVSDDPVDTTGRDLADLFQNLGKLTTSDLILVKKYYGVDEYV